MAMIDAITRLLPKALGHRESAENDSFYQSRLAWPIYTKPQEFEGEQVPKVLLSGHHSNIAKWRAEESLKRTQERRPDLLEE
jgi:tRNA (guanine37-N1)-methyltransferase